MSKAKYINFIKATNGVTFNGVKTNRKEGRLISREYHFSAPTNAAQAIQNELGIVLESYTGYYVVEKI